MSDALPSWRDTEPRRRWPQHPIGDTTVVSVKEDWATVFADTDE